MRGTTPNLPMTISDSSPHVNNNFIVVEINKSHNKYLRVHQGIVVIMIGNVKNGVHAFELVAFAVQMRGNQEFIGSYLPHRFLI